MLDNLGCADDLVRFEICLGGIGARLCGVRDLIECGDLVGC